MKFQYNWTYSKLLHDEAANNSSVDNYNSVWPGQQEMDTVLYITTNIKQIAQHQFDPRL